MHIPQDYLTEFKRRSRYFYIGFFILCMVFGVMCAAIGADVTWLKLTSALLLFVLGSIVIRISRWASEPYEEIARRVEQEEARERPAD